MSASVNDVLREIIDRHGRLLFDDARRFEGCLRDNALSSRDLAALLAAQKDGVPRRLAAQPAGVLTPASLANIAGELSERSGLSESVAAGAVAAIAHALRIDVAAETPRVAEEKPGANVTPRPVVIEPPQPAPAKRKITDLIGAILSVPVMLLFASYAFSGGHPAWKAIWIFLMAMAILAAGLRGAGRFFGGTSVSSASEVKTSAK